MTKNTKTSCWLEELPERLGRRREERRLRQVRGGVDLDGADDERHPGEEQQAEEGRFAQHRQDAGRAR